MRKSYSEVQEELVDEEKGDKNLKARTRFLTRQLLLYKERQKMMVLSYERVIESWKKAHASLLDNWHKILIAKIVMWYNSFVERLKQCYG